MRALLLLLLLLATVVSALWSCEAAGRYLKPDVVQFFDAKDYCADGDIEITVYYNGMYYVAPAPGASFKAKSRDYYEVS